MATTGNFPTSHTTTTTTSSTRVVIAPCRFDPSYIRTIPGILKIIQVVLDLIGFICAMSTVYSHHSHANWFSFVSVTGFWVTGILLFFYLFHLIERLHMLPWLLMEFVYCLIWTVFYLIGACLMASIGHVAAFGAAAFFGFLAMIAYGYDAFLKFRGWRSDEIAQGERHVSSTTTQATY